MTSAEAIEIVGMIVAGFPHGKLDKLGAKVYLDNLQDLDGKAARRAVIRLLRTVDFTPSIAEVRRLTGSIRKDMLDAAAVRERRKALPLPQDFNVRALLASVTESMTVKGDGE